MKIVTIIGARPQFIKAATISRAIARHNALASNIHHRTLNEIIVHTGQHYDDEMSAIFFRELAIPKPKYNLNIGSGTHGGQTGQMLAAIETVLIEEKPDWVLIYGDTNSTLAGALAAAKLHIPIAHVESGLRSYNRQMPEEINRIIADQLSSLLFCPSKVAVANLKNEGITKGVFVTGDVMADALHFAASKSSQHSNILKHLDLKPKRYILATVHRAENTDNPKRLISIMNALSKLAKKEPVIFPLHPRTKNILRNINSNHERKTLNIKKRCHCEEHLVRRGNLDLEHSTVLSPSEGGVGGGNPPSSINHPLLSASQFTLHPSLKIIDPVGYFDIIALEKNARIIMTDSGGMQKEAYWLKVPCITLRDETEWIETVECGWNILTGAGTTRIIKAANNLKAQGNHPLLYGNGKAAANCLKELMASLP